MSYRCNKQHPCKHLSIEFEVFTAMDGDCNVRNVWHCLKRDDERCVPNCKEYERAVKR